MKQLEFKEHLSGDITYIRLLDLSVVRCRKLLRCVCLFVHFYLACS